MQAYIHISLKNPIAIRSEIWPLWIFPFRGCHGAIECWSFGSQSVPSVLGSSRHGTVPWRLSTRKYREHDLLSCASVPVYLRVDWSGIGRVDNEGLLCLSRRLLNLLATAYVQKQARLNLPALRGGIASKNSFAYAAAQAAEYSCHSLFL